jgi:hypothetical protein
MGNRKQPFGYKIELGVIVIQSEEAKVVRNIFQKYNSGLSYQNICDELSKQPVHYDDNKPWNKNMVARIVDDRRYVGEKNFPQIIEPETMYAAHQKKTEKQPPIQKTEAQKLIRRLSGHTATKSIEQQVLNILNRLIDRPELIAELYIENDCPREDIVLQRQLEHELNQQPINEEVADELILTIARTKYSSIGSEEYESQRLRRIFSRASPIKELDAELLRSTVANIQIGSEGIITIRLKNNQEIGREIQ